MNQVNRARAISVSFVSFVAVAVLSATAAFAGVALTKVSSDPFTNPTSAHRTQVEPDTFAFGLTIVSAFQSGRFFDGGSSDIGWATSKDGGVTWVHGFLRGVTKLRGTGPYDRVSDPSVAYDAAHDVWIISSLTLLEAPSLHGAAVVASRSTDGGLTWSAPVVTVATGADLDKSWTVCDTTASSPFFGRCYTEWDNHGAGNLINMSTSADGGATWSPPATTANRASGLGGQPVVRPDGTVVVPIDNANETGVLAFRSTDGGATWSSTVTVATITDHQVAGNLRAGPLVSAGVDGTGRVYVAWQDCRFQLGCNANDIVMSTSANGTSWSPVARVPIDGTTGKVDHFLPGLGVLAAPTAPAGRLGLTYHFYPSAQCTASTCKLKVGYVSSADGGAHWTAPTQLAGPMSLAWLAPTTQGSMVGDYISTSFSGGLAHPVFAVAHSPSGGVLDEAMHTPSNGLPASAGLLAMTSTGDRTRAGAASDHASSTAPLTQR